MNSPSRRSWVVSGLAVGLACVVAAPGWSQEQVVRTRAAVLVQEADLLLQEAAALEPGARQVEQQGDQLAADERKLEAEVVALESELRQYNTDARALAAASRAQVERCAGSPLDAPHAMECNDEGARIGAEAVFLEQRRVTLEQRQQVLNSRIDRHNARRAQWERAKREADSRRSRNESDAHRWVQRARAFWATDGFAALSRAAGSPEACSAGRLSVVSAAHPLEALRRMQRCLKAVGP